MVFKVNDTSLMQSGVKCFLLIFLSSFFAFISTQAQTNKIQLTPFVTGLEYPVYVTTSHDNSDRMFVVEQGGKIKIIKGGQVQAESFLDISAEVKFGYEAGLLCIVFYPQFASNGRLFVSFVHTTGDLFIREYRVSTTNPDLVDTTTARDILKVPHQDSDYHYGGQLQFGRDKFLYISTGDGGPQGDPNGNGQNLKVLLGKILRINVNEGSPYSIPHRNPLVKKKGARKEIYAYGFRNPWRFSFDSKTGELFAGDVGYTLYEEIDLVTAGGNYGWRTFEGNRCFGAKRNCDKSGLTMPIATYPHSKGLAVIGGYVYRGEQIPWLKGRYLFADYSSGRIWSLKRLRGKWLKEELFQGDYYFTSFGVDSQKELYLADFRGTIFNISTN